MTMTKTEVAAMPSNGHSTAMVAIGSDDRYKMALEPVNMGDAMRLAATLAKVRLCGVTSAEDALVRILTGRELGLTALQSMRLVYVVKGRPALDASFMSALCLQSPNCEFFEIVETTDTKATYRAKRKGRPEIVMSFTIEQAVKAGLVNRGDNPGDNNWNKYPAAMLRARAISSLARVAFPEAIAGLHSREEYYDGDVPEEVNEITGEVVATGGRDFGAELLSLKAGIDAADSKETRTAARAAVAAFAAEAGEPYASDAKAYYNEKHSKPAQPAKGNE